jgi:hypothetical protein
VNRDANLSLADLVARRTPQAGDGCRIWQGAISGRGYGVVKHRRRQYLAHRAAYEVANGPIPSGMQVCHRCDTPACVRLDHLFLGTGADNMADKVAKGRQAKGSALAEAVRNSPKYRGSIVRGERHCQAKLSDAERQALIASLGTASQSALAARFGVSQSRVSQLAAAQRGS